MNALETSYHNTGYKYENDDVAMGHIVPYTADFIVKEVILSTNVICSNPFVSFEFDPRIKSSSATLTDKDGELDEDLDRDEDIDLPEEERKSMKENDDERYRKLKYNETSYFQVSLCPFTSTEEEASAHEKLREGLNEVGYYDKEDDINGSQGSDEERDKKLDELDRRQREE